LVLWKIFKMQDKRSSIPQYMSEITGPGPYLARVVNNLDPMRQGSLEVELLKPVGNQTSADQQTFVVRYLNPFYGTTNVELNGSDPKEFNHTQRSYGFWFVPPDTGTIVMVIFVEGDPGQGFWMGCVQNSYVNHMIPGIAGSAATQDQLRVETETAWTDTVENVRQRYGTTYVPVGEINRKALAAGNENINANVDQIRKPVHPMAEVLFNQGTLNDNVRGVHGSSARRETPSAVYGISTPGPLDKRQNAQRGNVGRRDNQVNAFISRLGGHTIVMDDGNERVLRKYKPWEGPYEYVNLEQDEITEGLVNFPEDESFRIRTRTGHQILLHNSEDVIYITNSRGTAWIELTSNGKIDIYSRDSISVRTEQDFNFVAERDFNVHANRSINFHSGSSFNIQALNDINASTKTNMLFSAENSTSIKAVNKMNINSDVSMDIKTERLKVNSTTSDFLTSGRCLITATNNLELKSGGSSIFTSANDTHILSGITTRLQQVSCEILSSRENALTSGTNLLIRAGTDIFAAADSGNVNLSAGSETLITSLGGNTHMKSSGETIIQGSQVHINGKSPNTAAIGRIALFSLQAEEATSADSADVARELVLYPMPGVGQVLVKRAPTQEPYSHHENFNPPGFSASLTDREASDMPYGLNDERLSIRRTSDADSVPAELGGNSGWAGGPGTGSGRGGARSGTMSTVNPDNTTNSVGTPPSEAQLSRMPTDWAEDRPFLARCSALSRKFGIAIDELLAFIYFETAGTMSPSITNSLGFTGLIQFGNQACTDMSRTYRESITTGQLRQMSRVEQMVWVERYFDMWMSRQRVQLPLTIEKMYMLVALPAFVNRPPDEILASAGGPNERIWQANPGWRTGNRTGPITPRSIGNAPRTRIATVRAILQRAGINVNDLSGQTSTPTAAELARRPSS
jgi:uncharacterized protein (DUF2345 family)